MSELKAIESSTAVIGNVNLVYIKSEADKVIAELEESHKMEVEQLLIEIAELKDKCLMHDFFREGCGFAKRGFKNTIAVSEAFDKLEEENAELKAKLEDVQAMAYTDSVDAGMRERKLQRALYKACANWADCKACILEYVGVKLHAKKWEGMFNKCRAKAEQYK